MADQRDLRNAFQELKDFTHALRKAALELPASHITSRSKFAAALASFVHIIEISERTKNQVAEMLVELTAKSTTSIKGDDTLRSSLRSIVLTIVVMFNSILIPLERVSTAETERRSRTTTIKTKSHDAPLDLISLQEMSSLHAASELLVWWGIGTQLPRGLRPDMSTRLVSQSSIWFQPTSLYQFLTYGACHWSRHERPTEVNLSFVGKKVASESGQQHDARYAWCILGSMVSLLSKPQLSAIVLPGFIVDILSSALTLSSVPEEMDENDEEEEEEETPTCRATVMLRQWTRTTTNETSASVECSVPSLVVVGGMLRVLQNIGMHVAGAKSKTEKNSFLSGGEGAGLMRVQKQASSYLSNVLSSHGGLELVASELLGHLQPPEGGADPSQAELRVADLAVADIKRRGAKDGLCVRRYSDMLRQGMLLASRSLVDHRVHHSLIRVAVMIVARCCSELTLS